MQIVNLNTADGRIFGAGRRTVNLVGGTSPLQSERVAMGVSVLEPEGQVPWHNHEQEEVYLVLEGTGEICVGNERARLCDGQATRVPPHVYHQLTNIGSSPLRLLYCYAPAGDVAHWRQELAGTLPRAGVDVPPLPAGSRPQRTETLGEQA